jgi:hypothetical protein
MATRKHSEKGGPTFLEFVLVGIPIIFVLISVFEMARGMWTYNVLAFAIKEGTRYVIVHGKGCGTAPNSCQATIGQIATQIQNAGTGLLPEDLSVTLTSLNSSVTCPAVNNCPNPDTIWPPDGGNDLGAPITITGTYPFRSALSMFWPGAGSGINFGVFTLPASSREIVQF